MNMRGRGRGLWGSRPPKNGFHPGSQTGRAVAQVTAPKSCRIVSLSNVPQRPPVASRLGLPGENTKSQPNGPRFCKGPLLPNPPIAPYSTNVNHRTPCKFVGGSSGPSSSAIPQLMSIQTNGKYHDIPSLHGSTPAFQKARVPMNPLERAARESSVEKDKDDFTSDVHIDDFANSAYTHATPVQDNLDNYVLGILDSLEENSSPVDRRHDLEEGECEEPQDFPSRMIQYHLELEAGCTLVPAVANATKHANQNKVKAPSPVNPVETRNLKQALEEIRRRESHSNHKLSPTSSQVVEEKTVRVSGSIGEIPGGESERRSSSQASCLPSNNKQVIVSYDPKEMRLTVPRQDRHSPKPNKDDTEWRREVRIVERREHSRERQPSREREVRRVQRSDSRNRSRSPWRRQVRRSPVRRRSRSRSAGRRRSRSRSPTYRRARSRTRSSPIQRQRSRSGMRRISRSPVRRGIRSPIRREIRSPIRREVRSPNWRETRSPIRREVRSPNWRDTRSPIRRETRSPIRRGSRSPARNGIRDRSRTPYTERKVVVRRSRSPCRQSRGSSASRTPTPSSNFREELIVVSNGTSSTQKSVVSQHFVPTSSVVTAAAQSVVQPIQASTSYATCVPLPTVPSQVLAHPGYYGQPLVALPQEHYLMHQLSSHQQGMHQQFLLQQHSQQFEEHLQQQRLNYTIQQQQLEQNINDSPIPPVGASTDSNQNLAHISAASSNTSALSAQKEEMVLLEQRLRAQRDSKLEKQLSLIHQLLMVRFQQADFEQKQKVATTEVERERLTLNILEKAKLEKELATSAQSLEKFIQRATSQLKEDLEEIKKEKTNYLYRFYDPQQHWCELCEIVCEKLPDYLNHLHSKEHEHRLESTGVPSMPWHNKQKPEDQEKATGKDGLIANRIPFGGLQSLQPVKAWYCELCDAWMGDLHCAQLHMTSTQHNNSYLKRTMERPDPGFLYAVKKQAAIKRNCTRKKEEERVQNEAAKKRKVDDLLEARKKKKQETAQNKQQTAGTRKEITVSAEESYKDLSVVNDPRDTNDKVTFSGSSGQKRDLEKDVGSETGSPPASAETPLEEANQRQLNVADVIIGNGSEKTNMQVEIVSGAQTADLPVASGEMVSNEECGKRPPDGSEEVSPNESVVPTENVESANTTFREGNRANEPQEGATNAKANGPQPNSNDCQIESQKHGVTQREGRSPGSEVKLSPNTKIQHSSTKFEIDRADRKSIIAPLELERDTSGPLSSADRNISSPTSEKVGDSASCPADSSSQRSFTQETRAKSSHSTQLQVPSTSLVSISVKREPEELRPVKVEPCDSFENTTARPVTLVKAEPLASANQAEGCSVAPTIVPERTAIKNEIEIKKEIESPKDNEQDADRQSELDNGSDDEDCCIVDEVDPKSTKTKNIDTVDLEPSATSPPQKGSASSSRAPNAPNDASEPEVSVKLSDYIVLSETGDDGLQEPADVDQ